MSFLSKVQYFVLEIAMRTGVFSRQAFYANKTIIRVEWWVSYCTEYPDLGWARIRELSDGSADASFDEKNVYGFVNSTYAANFISEDEFWRVENLDNDDLAELGAEGVKLCPPSWSDRGSTFVYVGKY